MNWFWECRTFEQGRALYKKLAQEHHPDKGGDVRIMQEINSQWARFKRNNRPSPGARPETPPPPGASRAAPPPPRPRQQYKHKTKSVRMPETHRRSFTRTVKLIETTYICRECRKSFPLDWYPGSWKPLYCPEHKNEAAKRANRDRQKRYRDAHKKEK